MNTFWWKNSVIYQIYPKSFNDTTNSGTGDLIGIIEKLPYLKNLGVDVLWLSPIYKSPMKDNGYDISDYQDIDPSFGTMEDMDLLLKEAKNMGIRIVMDLVINHTSDQHKWFIESKKGKDNPYRDYYIWRNEPTDMTSCFGGSAWEYDETTNQYYFHNFAKEQPDLNWENPVIMDEMVQMINFWLKKGIGGFRLDVIDLIGKEIDNKILGNGPRLHSLINDLRDKTWGNYNVITVGETWGATPEIAELYSDPDRKELSMIFQFEHITSNWGSYGKWKPKDFDLIEYKEIITKWQTTLKKGWNSLFWNNHDLPRAVSTWGDDKKYRVESAKMLGGVQHFLKGTPYIFQGEELGMTNVKFNSLDDYDDVEIHGSYHDFVIKNKTLTHDEFMEGVYRSGRDNARTPMQWDDTENAGFTKGKPWLKTNPNYTDINALNALNDKNSVFYAYQKLISFRKNPEISPIILNGTFEILDKENTNVLTYKREHNKKSITVIANFTNEIQSSSYLDLSDEVIFSNYETIHTHLNPYEIIVYLSK